MSKRAIGILLLLLASAGGAYWVWGGDRANGPDYRFATVERGDLTQVVSATGNLEAVTTVLVGTQVSGIISAIYADFNDEVEEGQVIARLDTSLLETAVANAETTLELRRAELRQAERDRERIATLFEQGVVPSSERDDAELALEVARSQLETAEVSLARARRDLGYATITSPIDGTVISRSVDVGQTVAASLSAPELFLIAADLSKMQILAAVDESDIGSIHPGQTARFTVQAYPDDRFTGTVRQVRLQSTTQENVVSYTVVIDVDNREGELLPGMTATVDFVVSEATDVLMVANSALRFRPPEEMLADLRERRQREGDAGAMDGTGQMGGPRRMRGPGQMSGPGSMGDPGAGDGVPREEVGRRIAAGASGEEVPQRFGGGAGMAGPGVRLRGAVLWSLDENGGLRATPVREGITDGQTTEIEGPGVEEGLQVLVGITDGVQRTATNPFQSQDTGRRGQRVIMGGP